MIYRLFNVFKMPLTLPRVSLRLLLRACKRATRISGSTVLWPQLQYIDEWRETVKAAPMGISLRWCCGDRLER